MTMANLPILPIYLARERCFLVVCLPFLSLFLFLFLTFICMGSFSNNSIIIGQFNDTSSSFHSFLFDVLDDKLLNKAKIVFIFFPLFYSPSRLLNPHPATPVTAGVPRYSLGRMRKEAFESFSGIDGNDSKHHRILIVDDVRPANKKHFSHERQKLSVYFVQDPLNLRILERRLNKFGLETTSATDGVDALEKYKAATMRRQSRKSADAQIFEEIAGNDIENGNLHHVQIETLPVYSAILSEALRLLCVHFPSFPSSMLTSVDCLISTSSSPSSSTLVVVAVVVCVVLDCSFSSSAK